MNPYYKIIFDSDTGKTVTLRVPNAKLDLFDGALEAATSNILGCNAIKTPDNRNLTAVKGVYYCTVSHQNFSVE